MVRLAACKEALGDGKSWSFYLLNDAQQPIESAVLYLVGHEWGDTYIGKEEPDLRVGPVAPGDHALLWRDDDDGAEFRIDLHLRVRAEGREVKMLFEFPKLDRVTS